MKLNLQPLMEVGRRKSAVIKIDYKTIIGILGEPNTTKLDDPYSVKAAWGFRCPETKRKLFVWCFKYPTAESCDNWSADGDLSLLKDVFGTRVSQY